MIRSMFRLLGLVLLAAGFVFLIYDGTKSIADQTIYISKFSQTWAEIHQYSLQALQDAVEKNAALAVARTATCPRTADMAGAGCLGHDPDPAWAQEEALDRLRAQLKASL